jgi:hypothetical protein
MSAYSGKIVREAGGSVLRFTSGASLVLESGTAFQPSGHTAVQSGASLQVANGGSLVIKPGATTGGQAYPILNMGNNQMWYAPGSPGSPITSASPGDLMWIANSASTSLWVNLSNGTTGSRWGLVRLGNAGSQIVTGP